MNTDIYRGVIPALMTPCNEAGEPDHDALVTKAKDLIGRGMSAVVYCGSMGDWPLLTDAQRQAGVARLTEAGVPVVVGNDATAGTFAEWQLGAGRDADNFAMVTLGTGIGTGFVVDGRLLRGASGFAGESGHMVVDVDGPVYRTGQRGPWEYFASGTALARLGRKAAASGEFPWGVAKAGGADAVTSQHVAAGAAEEVEDALRILDGFCQEVGQGLANLVLVLDLELVVIGGGLCRIGEPLRSGVEHWLLELLLGSEYRPAVRVVLAELGAEAEALGAALIATELL